MMNTILQPIITEQGLAAVANAQSQGGAVTITALAVGDANGTGYIPDSSSTTLVNEIYRLPITGGVKLNERKLHLTSLASGNEEYPLLEMGFVLNTGELLAIYSEPTFTLQEPLAYKGIGADLLLSFNLSLETLPANSVLVDESGSLKIPPAKEGVSGLITLATKEQVAAGIDTQRVVTPVLLAERYSVKPTPGKVPIANHFGLIDPNWIVLPWSTKFSKMPTARFMHTTSVVDGIIYAIGEREGDITPLPTVQALATLRKTKAVGYIAIATPI